MGDWIEVGEYFLLNISSGSRVKVSKSYGDIIILYKSGKDEHEQKFRSLEEAQSFYNKIKSQLIPKTIETDYGPDNVSTPDDIAETNELESSMKDIEDIKKQIDWLRILKEKVIGLDTKEFKEILLEIWRDE